MTDLGQQVRFLRKKNHLSQQALADAAGVHVNTVSYFEHGERYPSTETVSLLLDALGCELVIRPKRAGN